MLSLDAPLSPDFVAFQRVRPGRGSGCKQLLTLIVILILVNLWVRCEKQFVLALRLIYLCVIPLLKHMKAWLSSLCTVGVWAPGYLWPYTHKHNSDTHTFTFKPSFWTAPHMICRRGAYTHQRERAFHLGRCSSILLSWGSFMHKRTVWSWRLKKRNIYSQRLKKILSFCEETNWSRSDHSTSSGNLNKMCIYAIMCSFLCICSSKCTVCSGLDDETWWRATQNEKFKLIKVA